MIEPIDTADRTERLVRMITMLQHDDGWTVERLIDTLGVSRRTLFRDLKCLQKAGVVVRHQRNHGYSIKGAPVFELDGLSIKEMLGLMMLGKIGLRHSEQPMVNYGLSAVYKSLSAAPEAIRQACSEIMSCVDVQRMDMPASSTSKKHFLILLQLIEVKHGCSIVVDSQNNEPDTSYDILPLKLVLKEQGWVLYGDDAYSSTTLEINLARIRDIKQCDHTHT